MRPWVLLSACLLSASVVGAKSYLVDGIVVAVNRSSNTIVVSHRPIARYMDAMTMPFHVGNAGELDGLYPGARVQFDLEVGKEGSVARNVRKSGGGDAPIVPQNAALKPGEAVPDFQLTDQQGRTVHLADFRGEVVAI